VNGANEDEETKYTSRWPEWRRANESESARSRRGGGGARDGEHDANAEALAPVAVVAVTVADIGAWAMVDEVDKSQVLGAVEGGCDIGTWLDCDALPVSRSAAPV